MSTEITLFIFSKDIRLLSALVPDNENISHICFSREIKSDLVLHASSKDLALVEISKFGITVEQVRKFLTESAFPGTIWAYHLHPTLLVKRSLFEMGVAEVLGPDTDNIQKIDAFFQSTEIS